MNMYSPRHYIHMADNIRSWLIELDLNIESKRASTKHVKSAAFVITNLIHLFQADNHKFKRHLFIKAIDDGLKYYPQNMYWKKTKADIEAMP